MTSTVDIRKQITPGSTPEGSTLDLNKLRQEYSELCPQEREHAKVALIKKVLEALREKKIDLKKTPSQDLTELKKSNFWTWVDFFIVLGSSLIINFMHSFSSQTAFLGLFSGLSSPLFYVLLALICALNTGLCILFEGYIIKENLELTTKEGLLKSNLSVYTEQKELVDECCAILNRADTLSQFSSDEYRGFRETVGSFIDNLEATKTKFKPFSEDPRVKKIRYGMLTFGAFMAGTGAYFTAKALIKIIAVSLLGTPVGWGLVALTAALALRSYFGLKPQKIYHMLNPTAERYEQQREQFLQCQFPDKAKLVRVEEDLRNKEKDRATIAKQESKIKRTQRFLENAPLSESIKKWKPSDFQARHFMFKSKWDRKGTIAKNSVIPKPKRLANPHSWAKITTGSLGAAQRNPGNPRHRLFSRVPLRCTQATTLPTQWQLTQP